MGKKMYPNRKQEVFDYIIKYKTDNDGQSPSMRNIMANTDITATSVVSYILDELENDGLLIKRSPNMDRGIRVIGGKWTYDKEV